jgi:teichoic acid transport system permease protein
VPHGYTWLLKVNPLAGLLTAWSDALFGVRPDASSVALGLAWGLGIFLVAGLFFLSREREFAVRL